MIHQRVRAGCRAEVRSTKEVRGSPFTLPHLEHVNIEPWTYMADTCNIDASSTAIYSCDKLKLQLTHGRS